MGGPSRAALTCSPSSFVFDLSKMPSNRTMRLSNDTARAADGGAVAFKVMTTNRDRYRVKPTTGVLLPGEHIDVLLILSTSEPLPADVSAWSKDKFMVKAVGVPAGSTEATIKERWASAPASEIQQTKLGCSHRLPGQPGPEEPAPRVASSSTAAPSQPPRAEPRSGQPEARPEPAAEPAAAPRAEARPEARPEPRGRTAVATPAPPPPAAATAAATAAAARPVPGVPPPLPALLLSHMLSSLPPGAHPGPALSLSPSPSPS